MKLLNEYIDLVNYQVYHQIDGRTCNQFWNKFLFDVHKQVWGQIIAKLWDQVRIQVRNQVRNQIY